MRSVPLSDSDYEQYYEGYSNSTLWPLYHDAVETPAFHRRWWEAYQRVNKRFAQVTADYAERNAIVWIQDYHLQLVPALLRELRPDLRIGFFMHIPFPPSELFMQLPRRSELLRGMLGADLVGFQTAAGAENFTRLAARLLSVEVNGSKMDIDGRTVRASAFPISIDVNEMEVLGRNPDVVKRAAALRADLGDPAKVILGVDRLDYTKGIEHRLKAYRELLTDGRVKVLDTVMVQVAVPSRERVEHYKMLRDKVEREVGRINGEFGRVGVPAVHYLNQSFDRPEVAALYLAADVMAVTPLRDGMNLVAKEYIAARVDNGGALMLSEFTGAAAELPESYMINPHDVDSLKDTLVRALDAPAAENRVRMRAMRRRVKANDVRVWARTYLKALEQPAR
jgi:trehalose 6-phosphate synthase